MFRLQLRLKSSTCTLDIAFKPNQLNIIKYYLSLLGLRLFVVISFYFHNRVAVFYSLASFSNNINVKCCDSGSTGCYTCTIEETMFVQLFIVRMKLFYPTDSLVILYKWNRRSLRESHQYK